MMSEVNTDRLDKYVEESEIEVPEDLVEAEIESMTIEFLHRKRYDGFATGEAYMPDEEEVEATRADIRREAVKQVKTGLVLEAIIEKEKFEVTPGELEEEAKEIAERQQTTVEAMKGFFGEDLSMLTKDILFKKAIRFITG